MLRLPTPRSRSTPPAHVMPAKSADANEGGGCSREGYGQSLHRCSFGPWTLVSWRRHAWASVQTQLGQAPAEGGATEPEMQLDASQDGVRLAWLAPRPRLRLRPRPRPRPQPPSLIPANQHRFSSQAQYFWLAAPSPRLWLSLSLSPVLPVIRRLAAGLREGSKPGDHRNT
ncbi:unnamed protein product [Cutaneotrichosporon oleaginosum]